MINFQRMVDEYKTAKRETAEKIQNCFSFLKEDLNEVKNINKVGEYSLGWFINKWSTRAILGMFTVNLERDLEKKIVLLGKSRTTLCEAQSDLSERNISATIRSVCKAEKYFLEFTEKELEKKLTDALKKHLKKVKV